MIISPLKSASILKTQADPWPSWFLSEANKVVKLHRIETNIVNKLVMQEVLEHLLPIFKSIFPEGNDWRLLPYNNLIGYQGHFDYLELNLVTNNFSSFLVLKISGLGMTTNLVVDLSPLLCLKSLEVSGKHLVLQGLTKSLIFRSSKSDSLRHLKSQIGFLEKNSESSPDAQLLTKQIGCFKELQCLDLANCGGSTSLPDMRSMVSMRKAIFFRCENVVSVSGLSSKLSNLRVLDLRGCRKLRSCPGVGDLVDLEELICKGCRRLKRLPNLPKLDQLQKLDLRKCPLINGVPGLGDLVALEKLCAGKDNGSLHDNASYKLKAEQPSSTSLS